MAIVLGLLAALAYGLSDFAAGLSARHIGSGLVVLIVQVMAFGLTLIVVLMYAGNGPSWYVAGWGIASGIGSAIGTYALYRGLAIGEMSVVAPLSAVIAAVVPAIAGLILGERLSFLASGGLIVAIPAIGLVSWQPSADGGAARKSGVAEGIISGVGFALLFFGLDQAGTGAGAWPLVFGLAVAILIVFPLGWRDRGYFKNADSTLWLVIAAGLVGGVANLLFLIATGYGELIIVAVLTALYPAVTILLARVILSERWNRAQAAGLVAAAVAVTLITIG